MDFMHKSSLTVKKPFQVSQARHPKSVTTFENKNVGLGTRSHSVLFMRMCSYNELLVCVMARLWVRICGLSLLITASGILALLKSREFSLWLQLGPGFHLLCPHLLNVTVFFTGVFLCLNQTTFSTGVLKGYIQLCLQSIILFLRVEAVEMQNVVNAAF